jgi:hypothetical protein
MAERTYVLVLRVWQEPDGRFAVRLRGQVEPDGEPEYVRATSVSAAPSAVAEWLDVVTMR